MARPHDRACPHKSAPRFSQSPVISSSYRNRLDRISPPPPEPPAPTPEDFTTYTELDLNNHLTVAPNIATAAALERDEDVWLYADKGLNHFTAAWQHKLKTTLDHTGGKTQQFGSGFPWSISQTIADAFAWDSTTANAISLQWYDTGTEIRLYLRDWHDGTLDFHNYGNAAAIFTAYPIVERTSETNVQCRVYSDAARLVLIDTLNVTITSGVRHRYVFAMNSYNTAQPGREFYGTSANLYL